MPVISSDLTLYKSEYVTNTTANGGVISDNEITDNVLNNLFPNILDAERVAGGSRYRKFFLKNENSSDISTINPAVLLSSITASGDYMQIHTGTDTDTQAEADDYTAWKGAGVLNAGVSAGGTEIVADYEAASGVANSDVVMIRQIKLNLTGGAGTFQANEKITAGSEYGWINDVQTGYIVLNLNYGLLAADVITGMTSGATATISSIEQKAEYLTVSNTAWDSNAATLTVSQLANDYLAGSVVSTLVDTVDLTPTSSGWTETSSAGTYDESSYPITLYNIGTTSEDWTLTFSNATTFSVVGSITGSVGSGTTGGDFKPVNGSSYYFMIATAGWGGTWANGDTIEFTTVHAAQGMWVKQTWAAAIASGASDVMLAYKGESA